ncbi:mechanosensitive ion channel family protein [Kiloniella laminariae]|uniref:mechanosensitive ion channel family protein n=1 Tax=Kiloniella laminariae TaxID=454162 RepID=UPI00037F1F11|nr:mechanosensitive ion channel domain-containing protein [Kiloniella laminariae]
MLDEIELPNLQEVEQSIWKLLEWLSHNLLSWPVILQLALLILLLPASRYLGKKISPIASEWNHKSRTPLLLRSILSNLRPLIPWVLYLIALWITLGVLFQIDAPLRSRFLINTVASLTLAWVIISLTTSLIKTRIVAKMVTLFIWAIAALNILGQLDLAKEILDSAALDIGGLRISLLMVLKGVISLAVLLWGAIAFSSLLERRVKAVPELTPSVQVLLGKLLKVTLIGLAIIIGLKSVGIDLSAFALFGGALGVGIGFGLQKVIANLVSGIILLMDRSIKPGDVIAVNNTYGWVKSFGARYASVITRDGTEHLIPNEEFITQRVENWSYSNSWIRVRVPVGVSYGSDIHKAIELCMEAAKENPRIMNDPAPNCLVTGFGDNSVNLEVRFWIPDPQNGLGNIKSALMLAIWDKFHASEVEFPFPQRDLHIKGPVEIITRSEPLSESVAKPAAKSGTKSPKTLRDQDTGDD